MIGIIVIKLGLYNERAYSLQRSVCVSDNIPQLAGQYWLIIELIKQLLMVD